MREPSVWGECAQANGGTRSLDPEHILSECAGSRERLGMETIDIYYAHWPDDNGVPLAYSCGAFAQLVREGAIKHWAVSNFSVEQGECRLPTTFLAGLRCHTDRAVVQSPRRWRSAMRSSGRGP